MTQTTRWRDTNHITDWEFGEVGGLLCDHELRELALMIVRLRGQLEVSEQLRQAGTPLQERTVSNDTTSFTFPTDRPSLSDVFAAARRFLSSVRGLRPTQAEVWSVYRACARPGACIFFRCTFRNEP